jgi:hypothetical protein
MDVAKKDAQAFKLSLGLSILAIVVVQLLRALKVI